MADVQELNVNKITYDIKAKSVVDNNAGSLKFWSGLNADYTSLQPKDNNTLYIITDTSEIWFGEELIAKASSASGTGLPLGMIFPCTIPIDESIGLFRNANGSKMAINANTEPFVKAIEDASALQPTMIAKSQDEWDAEKAASTFKQCGKYFINREAGYIQLPAIVNTQGLADLSQFAEIVDASLPNITGHTRYIFSSESDFDGAFFDSYASSYGVSTASSGAAKARYLDFDASLSNPIYGASDTVQQEQIQYPYYIVVATGATEEVNIKNEIELNNPFNLLESKYSELELDNISWLRSQGQWNNGNVYVDAYNKILENVNKGTKYFKSNMAYAFNGTINCWFPVRNPIVGAWAYSTTDGSPIGVVTAVDGDTVTVNGVVVTFSGGGQAGESLFTDYDFIINQANNTFKLQIKNQRRIIVNTYQDGNKWYRIYSDGWCEQGGFIADDSDVTVSLLKAYKDTNYQVLITTSYTDTTNNGRAVSPSGKTTTSFITHGVKATNCSIYWEAKGYLAEEINANLLLYYYVGETVQNANLIDAGRIQEQFANVPAVAAHAAMPSNRYIDLTLGASATIYTAPADGYFTICKQSNATNQYINMTNTVTSLTVGTTYPSSSGNLRLTMPVSKGQSISVNFNAGGTTTYFRFIYAEGAR